MKTFLLGLLFSNASRVETKAGNHLKQLVLLKRNTWFQFCRWARISYVSPKTVFGQSRRPHDFLSITIGSDFFHAHGIKAAARKKLAAFGGIEGSVYTECLVFRFRLFREKVENVESYGFPLGKQDLTKNMLPAILHD